MQNCMQYCTTIYSCWVNLAILHRNYSRIVQLVQFFWTIVHLVPFNLVSFYYSLCSIVPACTVPTVFVHLLALQFCTIPVAISENYGACILPFWEQFWCLVWGCSGSLLAATRGLQLKKYSYSAWKSFIYPLPAPAEPVRPGDAHRTHQRPWAITFWGSYSSMWQPEKNPLTCKYSSSWSHMLLQVFLSSLKHFRNSDCLVQIS